MRLKPVAVERQRVFSHLPFAASVVEFANRGEYPSFHSRLDTAWLHRTDTNALGLGSLCRDQSFRLPAEAQGIHDVCAESRLGAANNLTHPARCGISSAIIGILMDR